MQGIIGETYERFTVGQEAFNPNSTYWLPEDVSGILLSDPASSQDVCQKGGRIQLSGIS